MPRLHNREEFNDRRKELRNNLTKAEVILWSHLKSRQFSGYKFRRQHGIGPYIVDFYCPKLKLAVELDGSQHFLPEGKRYDANRDSFINAAGIQVVRFSNYDVLKHIDLVQEALRNVVIRRGRLLDHPVSR